MSLLTDFSQLDTSHYKRFFVVGCSFTQWMWPTWANIIAKQNPHLEFHSFAKPGQGNTYISTLLNQLHYTHNLCKTDLVGVMWSTFHRLDYYTSNDSNLENLVKGTDTIIVTNRPEPWNMHSDTIHPQLEFGNKKEGYCDRGFLMRDLAIIDNSTTVMQHAPYTAFQMFSVEPEQQNNYDLTLNGSLRDNSDIIQTYSHLNDKMASKSTLFNEMGNTFTTPTVSWIPAWKPDNWTKKEADFHPSSSINCQFLQSNGYAVTQNTLQYCAEIDAKVQRTQDAKVLLHDTNYPYGDKQMNHPWPM